MRISTVKQKIICSSQDYLIFEFLHFTYSFLIIWLQYLNADDFKSTRGQDRFFKSFWMSFT